MGGILTKKTLTMLKYGVIVTKVLNKSKNKKMYCSCFTYIQSLIKGIKKEFFCRFFAEKNINLYECLSTKILTIEPFLVSYQAHTLDRHSYKLIKKDLNMSEELLTKEELAVRLNISAYDVDRLRKDKKMPSVKIGRAYRFNLEAVLDFIKKLSSQEEKK